MTNDIRVTLTLDGAQQAQADLKGIEDGAREAGQAVYDSATKAASAQEYVRFWEEALNNAAEAERRLAEEQAFQQKLAEAAQLNRAGEYVRFWEESLQQAEATERRLADEQGFQKKLADAAQLNRASEYVRFWEESLQQAEATEKSLADEQVFQKKLADAAQLNRASEYVRFWEEALQQAEVAERRLASETGFLDGLKRQTDAIGKTRADLLELQAAELGVADKAAPFIQRLREAEGGLGRMGASAAQTKAALQYLPAQITDIVTGLASGQAPFTVMIQQGGQLKDMFGGVGNAAKAVGGYILELINPYTLAAAAVAGLTAAYYEGSKEADAYSTALIMSGNAAGATASQMAAQAQAVSAAAGVTQGAAASTLALIAATGAVASGNFGRVAEAALRMQEATGQAVSETVKQFEELGKSPVQASEKLNEHYHYLTGEIYRQIQALEEQGRVTEAAAVAQNAFADAIIGRSKEVVQNLGYIETAWKGIANMAKYAIDTMLDVGRQQTDLQRIAELEQKAAPGRGMFAGRTAEEDAELKRLKEKVAAEDSAAKAAGENARNQQASIDLAKEADKVQSKSQQRLQEIAKLEVLRAAAIKAAGNDQQKIAQATDDYQRALAGINEKYADKSGITDVYAARQAALEASGKLELAALKSQLDKASDLRAMGLLSEEDFIAEKRRIALEEVAIELDKQTRLKALADRSKDKKADSQKASGQISLLDQQRVEIEANAQREVDALQIKRTAALQDWLVSERDAIDQIQFEASLVGKTALEVERLTAARKIDLAVRNATKNADGSPKVDAATAGGYQAGGEIMKASQDMAIIQRQAAELGKALNDPIQSFSSGLRDSFATAGDGLARMIDGFGALQAVQKKYGDDMKTVVAMRGVDATKAAELEGQVNKRVARETVGSYASMAGAAKGFFATNTAGYKALQGAEQTFRAFELAMAMESMVKKLFMTQTVTAAVVTGNTTQAASAVAASGTAVGAAMAEGQANALVGVTNQAKGDPYSAWARMAAMAATMAALGFAVGGIGGGGGRDESQYAASVQAAQGTGTVLGDASAKSDSITKAMEAVKDVDTLTMRYSAQMAASLRNIESSMAGLSTMVARTYGLTTGDNLGVQTGRVGGDTVEHIGKTVGTWVGNYYAGSIGGDILGSLLSKVGHFVDKLWGGTTQAIVDSGIEIQKQTVSQLASGHGARQYGTVETTEKSWFGLSKDTSYSSVYGELPQEITRQFGLVFQNLTDSLSAASGALGKSTADIAAEVSGFTVDIGKISLQGLSGDKVQEALTNVFSAAYDRISASVLPGLENFQKVGEGYYETVIRVASGVEQAGVYAERFGLQVAGLGDVLNVQGDVATELLRASIAAAEGTTGIAKIIANYGGSAADMADVYGKLLDVRSALNGIGAASSDVTPALIRGAGGLDSLQSALSAYQDKFLTDSERLTSQQAALATQFSRLGISVPASTEDFKALVQGIDTTTESGQELLGQVLGLSSAFATVQDAFASLRTSLQDLVSSTLSSIADVRASTASSTQDITGKPTYTAAALRTQIAAAVSGLTLPSTAAIEAASRNVSTAKAQVEAKQAAVTAATAHQDQIQQTTATELSQYQAARKTADADLSAFRDILNNPGMVRKDPNYTERPENYDTGTSFAAHNYWTINGSTAANNAAAGAYSNAFSAALKQYAEWKASSAQLASATAATKAAQDALTASNASASAAQEAYSKAQDAYAAAIKGYVGDAQKATDALSKLREQTVAYYQQQQQLAAAMNTSAANLRKTLDGLATANLSPTAKLAKLQAEYDQAYAATLTSSGADLATKSDALNALISPLLDAARGVYASGAGYQQLLAAITRQAGGLADRLETTAPHDYQAESVALLSGIDAALAGLQANLQSADQAVVAAITAQTNAQVQILSDIRAQLAGQTLPGHADGLSWVPYDGYKAELHYGEAVVDARTMAGMRKYGIQAQPVVQKPLAERIAVPKMAPVQIAAQPSESRAGRQTLDELRAQTRELQALVRQNGAGMPAMLERLEAMERRLYSIERGLRQDEARA